MSKKHAPMEKWTTSDIGLIVPDRLYTSREVENLRRQDSQRRWAIDALIEPLDFAARAIDQAQAKIISSLLFVDSVNWESGLKQLQDEYNSKVTAGTQALDQAARAAPVEFKMMLLNMKDPTIAVASQINTAINAAIGGADCGAALRQLADESLPQMADLLREQADQFRTDHLARDRRIARAKVYIGVRCNKMEANGITQIKGMWQAIHRDLKSRQRNLKGDELAAWEYLRDEKPFDMTPTQLRTFEKEISDFKQDMKGYAGRV